MRSTNEAGYPARLAHTTAEIGPEVGRVARLADEAGLDSVWTADHLSKIPVTSLPRESPMLEAYATLAYIAGQTHRIQLGAMVTCVACRHPGMLLKAVTSLDVLSGRRVTFGVGAGWDVEEARSLGIRQPLLRRVPHVPRQLRCPRAARHARRIIELGERERFFTGGLRRVIEIRDWHCSHPGCYLPATFCEVDHVVEWAKGGETTQSKGRLLCPVHNRRRNTPIPLPPIPLGPVPNGPSP